MPTKATTQYRASRRRCSGTASGERQGTKHGLNDLKEGIARILPVILSTLKHAFSPNQLPPRPPHRLAKLLGQKMSFSEMPAIVASRLSAIGARFSRSDIASGQAGPLTAFNKTHCGCLKTAKLKVWVGDWKTSF